MAWSVSSDPARFEEAIQWFRSKTPLAAARYYKLEGAARDRGFTVSHVAQMDVIQSVLDDIDRAIEQGVSLRDFAKEAGPKLEGAWKGSAANPAHRIETIYRTNVQSAFSRARQVQMDLPEVKELRPGRLFDAVRDHGTTQVCRECDGTLVHADDPWIESHTPPLHHQCRSRLRSMRMPEVKRRGGFRPAHKLPREAPDDGFGVRPRSDDEVIQRLSADYAAYDGELAAMARKKETAARKAAEAKRKAAEEAARKAKEAENAQANKRRAEELARQAAEERAAKKAARKAQQAAQEAAAEAARRAAEQEAKAKKVADAILHRKVGEQLGSVEGGTYVGKDGVKRYVKLHKDPQQAVSEAAANSIYDALGVPAVKSETFAVDGAATYASRVLAGAKPLAGALTKQRAKSALDGIAADLLTANWGATGQALDNLAFVGATVYRVDNSGALLFAGGSRRKTGDLLDIAGIDTLFDPASNPGYARLMSAAGYSGPADLLPQLKRQLAKAKKAKGPSWKGFVAKHAPELTPQDNGSVVAMMEAREAAVERWIAATEKRIAAEKTAMEAAKREAAKRLAEAQRKAAEAARKAKQAQEVAAKQAAEAAAKKAYEDLAKYKAEWKRRAKGTTSFSDFAEERLPDDIVVPGSPMTGTRGMLPHTPQSTWTTPSKTVETPEILEMRRQVGVFQDRLRQRERGLLEHEELAEVSQFTGDAYTWMRASQRMSEAEFEHARRTNEEWRGAATYRETRRAVEVLERAIAKLQAAKDRPERSLTEIYRGLGHLSREQFAELLNLDVLNFEAPTSTSWRAGSAETFYSRDVQEFRVMLRIRPKEETAGVFVETLSEAIHEHEVLFPRGTQFRVIEIRRDATDPQGAIMYLEEV